jgi:hypothetical protein
MPDALGFADLPAALRLVAQRGARPYYGENGGPDSGNQGEVGKDEKHCRKIEGELSKSAQTAEIMKPASSSNENGCTLSSWIGLILWSNAQTNCRARGGRSRAMGWPRWSYKKQV